MKRAIVLAALLALALPGCSREAGTSALPQPREPTADTVAHFCSMAVLDHSGPKGQIFLTGKAEPIWFSSVRDTFAFTMLPEEPKNLAAIYVNDMGKVDENSNPLPGSWIEAHKAWFVVGSDYQGGMREGEIAPFSERAAAKHFARAHGGRVVDFAAVTERDVLGYAVGAPSEPGQSNIH